MLELYTHAKSSAAFRVRIALNIKGLPYTSIPINLAKNGGEQHQPEYKAKNPQGFIPLLIEPDTAPIRQSLAIIEYLDETHPRPPLLPSETEAKARVRSIAQLIACDIHPLNNRRVLKQLRDMGISESVRNEWYQHWIYEGFSALETILDNEQTGDFCQGNELSMADCCLVPQVYNGLRFNCDLNAYPTILRIYEHCLNLSEVQQAMPENQADA